MTVPDRPRFRITLFEAVHDRWPFFPGLDGPRVPRLIWGYVVGLFAVVGLSAAFPSSRPALILLAAWLGAFFLFALAVLIPTYVLFFVALGRGLRHLAARLAVPPTDKVPPVAAGLWDRDLDG